jgi:hypothetical protein
MVLAFQEIRISSQDSAQPGGSINLISSDPDVPERLSWLLCKQSVPDDAL